MVKIGLLTGEKNNDTTKVTPTITNAYDAHSLTTGYLKEGASKSYEFRLWMDGETTAEEIDSMNKTLVSKISVISTYATKVLETLEDTILGLGIQEEDSGATGLYQVEHSDANIEYTTEATKVQNLQKMEYRFAGKDPNNYISFGETEPKDVYEIQACERDLCFWGSEVMGLQTFDTNEECEETYNQMQEMFQGSGMTGSCKQKTKAGDKIYWRVIGLVNTPEGQRVKIIKNDIIGAYSWDTSQEGVNDGKGINEWSKSDLMKLLNPNFDGEDANNSLYWNSTSGNCYISEKDATRTCDFTGRGMPEKLKEMIEEVTWNTGVNADDVFKYNAGNYYYEIPTINMYEYERSKNNGKQLCESQGGKYCNDEETRTYAWRGKVGLMYASDYGYATSGGSEDTRSKCLNENLNFWKNYNPDVFVEETDHPNCYENDWLLPTYVDLTITPASYSIYAGSVFDVPGDGFVNSGYGSDAYGVRPSVYLTSNVFVLDEEGTKESPWILGIE